MSTKTRKKPAGPVSRREYSRVLGLAVERFNTIVGLKRENLGLHDMVSDHLRKAKVLKSDIDTHKRANEQAQAQIKQLQEELAAREKELQDLWHAKNVLGVQMNRLTRRFELLRIAFDAVLEKVG